MFIADKFSTKYYENRREKGWIIIARYDGMIVGAADVSMDTDIYKNICVCSYVVGSHKDAEREDIFKHFFSTFCQQEPLPVYFNENQLSDNDKKWLLDLGAEEMVDVNHETMWFKEDPTVLRLEMN